MRRGFTPRAGRPRVNMQWAAVDGQFLFSAITATAVAPLIQLQEPASLASLTADPPEDLTVLRVVGDFTATLDSAGSWTLGLMVADVTWTPGTDFSADADKRVLWHRTFTLVGTGDVSWKQTEYVQFNIPAGTFIFQQTVTHIDISPKVKVEAGKALYLVAWENTASGALTVATDDMRVLFKRSGRR